MEKVYLQEAFKSLNALNEEDYKLTTQDDVNKLQDFIDSDDDSLDIEVVDPEADNEEELEDSYVGKVLLVCNVCKTVMYKDPEEVIADENSDSVNINEECPFCASVDGFKIKGQVEEYEPETELKVEVEDKEDGEKEEVEAEEEIEEGFHFSKFDKNACKDGKCDKKTKMKEGFDKVELETGDKVIKVSEETKEEPISDEETVAPLDFDTIDTIEENSEMNNEEEGAEEGAEEASEVEEEMPELEDEDEDEINFDLDEVDEESVDNLGEAYLKKVYENVDSFKTTKVSSLGNSLMIEGVIKFNSGKSKNTTFVFEAKDATRSGKVRFIGENKEISRGKKSFTLAGKVNKGKLIAESLRYNYKAKLSEGKSTRVYGTVKLNESK